MLRNIDTVLDQQRVTRLVVSQETSVSEEIRVSQPSKPDAHRDHVTKDVDDWEWRELRDYVVTEIEKRFGAIPRDPKKEKGIFDSFMKRWGAAAPVIARYACEHADGRWRGAPLQITRFCKGQDAYFAAVIAERLGLEAPATTE